MMNLIFASKRHNMFSKNCVKSDTIEKQENNVCVFTERGKRAFSEGKRFMKSHWAQTFPRQFSIQWVRENVHKLN